MLRITTQNDTQLLTFRLEGRLAGPWVREPRDCWQSKVSCRPPFVRVDLRSVTFVDIAGKKLLAAKYRQGAKLLAHDCHMNAVVGEIGTAVSENG
jgi:hypothetical protein